MEPPPFLPLSPQEASNEPGSPTNMEGGEGKRSDQGHQFNVFSQLKDTVQLAADKVQKAADKVQSAGLNIADKVQKGLTKAFHTGLDPNLENLAPASTSAGASGLTVDQQEVEWARACRRYDSVHPDLSSVLSSEANTAGLANEPPIKLTTRLEINYPQPPASSSSSAPQVHSEASVDRHDDEEEESVGLAHAPPSRPPPPRPPPASLPSPPSLSQARQSTSTVQRSVEEIKLKYGKKSTVAEGPTSSASRAAGSVNRELYEARMKLEERGEKIKSLEAKAANLEDAAMGFEEMAKKLKEGSMRKSGWF